jgi:hypothetical protein
MRTGSEFIPVGEKRSPRNFSTICLWTINGRLVASTTCQERINCVALTHGSSFYHAHDRTRSTAHAHARITCIIDIPA